MARTLEVLRLGSGSLEIEVVVGQAIDPEGGLEDLSGRLGAALDLPRRNVPPDASTLGRSHLKPILRRAGLPREIRIHDLRHGSASVLADAGTPLNVLRHRLGHHSIRVTEVYMHTGPEAHRRAAETMDSPFGGARVPAAG